MLFFKFILTEGIEYSVVPPIVSLTQLRFVYYSFSIITSVCIAISMSLDAQKLTSALSALEQLDLTLDASSGDAVEELLFIPTLKQLKVNVVSDHVTTVPMLVGVGPDWSVYLPIPDLLQ